MLQLLRIKEIKARHRSPLDAQVSAGIRNRPGRTKTPLIATFESGEVKVGGGRAKVVASFLSVVEELLIDLQPAALSVVASRIDNL